MGSGQGRCQLQKARCAFRARGWGFEDPFALIELDESEEYGEDRFLLTGLRVAFWLLFIPNAENGSASYRRVRRRSMKRRNYYRAAQED